MANIRPTTLILTLSDAPQDARDLYREHKLACACCGNDNRRVHALRVEGLLRNLMDAVEAQGLDDKDMERLHAAMQDARRFFRP